MCWGLPDNFLRRIFHRRSPTAQKIDDDETLTSAVPGGCIISFSNDRTLPLVYTIAPNALAVVVIVLVMIRSSKVNGQV